VVMVLAELALGVVSVCWTAKQPPKGPARALLRQRTVQMLPVEAGGVLVMASGFGSGVRGWDGKRGREEGRMG